MDAYLEGTSVDEGIWNEIVASAGGHIFQTFHWAEVLRKFGVEAIPLMVEDRAVLMAYKIPMLTVRRIRTMYHTLQVLRGPVFKEDRFDRSALEEIVSRVVRYARAERVLGLDLFPNVPSSDSESEKYLLKQGFRPVYNRHSFHTQTYVLDCSQSEEELMKRMEKRTRWSIRKAQRLGVKVRDGIDEKLLDSFFKVYSSTNPSPQPKGFFEIVNKILGERGLARIFLSEVDGQCAAGLLALMFGSKIFYVWGGSNPTYKNYQPGVLLHWETIKWGRLHGYTYYDFHGALVEDVEKYGTDEKTANVTLFKRGFGGAFLKYMPQNRMVLLPLRYHLISLIRKAICTIR